MEMANEFITSNLPGPLRESQASVGIVLGSGLGSLAGRISVDCEIPYSDVPGLPMSGVHGHSGKFMVGALGQVPIIAASGRVHLYEGWDPREVCAGVRLLHAAGIRTLILTNAAGSVHPDYQVGRWMLIRDHINLTARSPLEGGPNFIDLAQLYSRRLIALFAEEACGLGIPLHEGVYAGVLGPNYETPAEIAMIRLLGAHAVGMSTILEAIQAKALGMEVCALSCLTNWAAGIAKCPLSHDEVVAAGKSSASSLARLLEAVLPGI